MNKAKLKIYFTNIPSQLSDLLMRAKKNWGAKLSGGIQSRYGSSLKFEHRYESIDDLPLYNWIKIQDGHLEYVRVGYDPRSAGSDRITDQDHKAWEKINDEYIERWGLGKLKEKMLKSMVKKAQAELEFCISGDRFKLTQAELEEKKLEQMMGNAGHGITIEQTLIHVSKWIGQWIKPKEISTQEYFLLIQELERYNKTLKQTTDGKKDQ